jgi:putative phosphoribosyl transferase
MKEWKNKGDFMLSQTINERSVDIVLHKLILHGHIAIPSETQGIVLFAHGSGSSHKSPRNRSVAQFFNKHGLSTLLFDLLTLDEEEKDLETEEFRFDIDLLSQRLLETTRWVKGQPFLETLPIGYFGASTGAAAAINAATEEKAVKAIVIRGGRPDLAAAILPFVTTPTFLIVGSKDKHVHMLNRQAFDIMHCERQLDIIQGASHLFEEPGAMEEVSKRALLWFQKYFPS